MLELLNILRDKDHWEVLGELSQALEESAGIIENIHKNMSLKEVGKAREELPAVIASTHILMEVVKVKLSIMPAEWTEVLETSIKMLKDANKIDNKFDDMEF